MDINYANLQALHITISAAFHDALAASPPTEWDQVAMRIGSSSGSNLYPFLGNAPSMREWLGDLITHQLASSKYSIDNRLFELTLEGDLIQIQDDQGGLAPLYSSVATLHGAAVAVQPDELVIGEVLANSDTLACYDGQPFIDANHPNPDGGGDQSNDMGGSGDAWFLFDTTKPLKPLIYQEREAPQFVVMNDLQSETVFRQKKILWKATRRNAGGFGLWQGCVKSKQTLSEATFVQARRRMREFKNDKGRNMGMNPNLIMVANGSASADVAEKLFAQDRLASGETNYVKNAVKVLVSKYLPVM